MNQFKKIFSLFLVTLLSFTLISCGHTKEKAQVPLSENELLMGTVVTISIYDKQDEAILKKCFDRVKEIENLVSINKLGTELDKVNDNSGVSPVKVSDTTYDIVKSGLYYSELTNGSFDITIGNLVKLWSIGLPEAKIPTATEITEALTHVGYKNLVLNDDEKSIFLKNKGMKLDLGSIAKGYTADEVAKILDAEGVKKAIINLGGNVLAIGEKAKDTPWTIGIQDPASERGDTIGTIKVSNKSIVTSGIYERYIPDHKEYHHLLSPFDGYPFNNELASVTIISDRSIDGDALSTSVFALGVEKGLEFLENQKNIEAIFVTKDNKLYLTSGVKGIFELKNDNFTVVN